LNLPGLCDNVEPGKTVSRECQSACYAKDRGHYRRSSCKNPKGQVVCHCIYDPCRNGEMDVAFLLDSSGSLGGAGFKQERDFIQTFVSKMSLGLNGSRVALVQFSTYARLRMSFTDIQSQDSFGKLLNGLNYDAGGTNIHAAFTMSTPLFKAKRPGVPQVAILVTDGVHEPRLSKGVSPAVPAKALRDQGVLIYAVGVGPEARDGLGNLVEYSGSDDRVFPAEFNDLQNVVNIIGSEVVATVNN